jgi:TPR repeat protein
LTVAGKQARPQALTALAGLQLHVGRGAGAYASAAEWLALASYDGDMAAMHTLGRLYQHGRGVEQDLYRAADWYRLAAESGCAQSAFALGLLMAEEGGPVQDDVAALGWLRTAAQRWHALAPCNLALMAYAGRGQPSNPAEALAILETAVCRGNVHATVMLAEWCTDGVHMQPSPQRARNLLSQAVTMGSVKAACLLVNLLDCTAQPGDAAQVRRVLARACATPPLPANLEASLVARAHDALACWLTRQTPGRPVDDELLMHRECAAEGGVADAQAWMADHLHQRSLAEPDQLDLPQRALYWYGQASRQGHVGALLAWHIWVDGASPGVPEKTDAGSPSDGRFFGLWVAAAGQGHVRAQLQLASMYVAGLGCPVDVAAARRWLQRAADQGDSMAQGRLRELGQA